MPQYTIRFALREDFDWIRTIEDELNHEILLETVQRKRIFIAESEGERLGLLRYELLWKSKPLIAKLFIIEKARRQGIAIELLKHFEQYLQTEGHTFLLSSTMPDNLISQQWHKRAGFSECGFLAGINEGGVGEIFYLKAL